MKSQRRFTEVSVALSFVMLTNQVTANPVGGTIAGGGARIEHSAPGALTIHQSTDRLVINWKDFSIAAGEVTRFIQPSASSIALNRVVGGNPSKLFGTLEANGKVYLLNPNGILVGRGGAINTRGFVASTLEVSDASFMSRAKLTLSGNSDASVVNEGSINAIGGDVFLIARNVENSGSVRAPDGTVGLAAGSEVTIVPTGNERITVIAGNSSGGQSGKGVNNLGTIEAVSAELKAAGGNIYALAVNNGGIVRATGVHREGGRVFLTSDGGNIENSGIISVRNSDGSGGSVVLAGGHNAGAPSTVINSGAIEARGEADGTKGGDVRMTGDHVGLFGSALIDVSGQAGGGVALVGGDYQGANSRVQNAQRTFVDDDAVIKADALAQGNGGKVVVWSDQITRFSGTIFARGGAEGGNGGFAEVSGKQFLGFNGYADLSAPLGLAGTILLDPQDVVIQDTGANDGLLADSTLAFNEPDTATDVTISDEVLEALTGNVLVQAHRNLTIDQALDFVNQTAGETVEFVAGGDLDINATVVTAGGSLSFTASDAGGANSATATLTVDAAVGDANTGAISFINDGSGGISIDAAVRTGDVSVADAGGAQTATSAGISVNSGGQVTLTASGSLTTGNAQVTGTGSGSDTATSGSINITGGGTAAVTLNGNVTTGAATVGNGTGNDDGVSGSVNVTSGGSILAAGALTTGNAEALEGGDNGDNDDTATSGLIALISGATGSITVNNNLTTGTAKVQDSAGDNDVANTGGISLSSGLGIVGSGRLITGAATLRGDATTGTDAANSGSILLTAGTGGASGGIGLSTADALTTGNAIRINASAANLDSDTRDTGDVTLNARDEINNGTASTPLSVLIGTPTIDPADQGAVIIAPTTPGGDVFLTSSATLRIGNAALGSGDLHLIADEINLVGGNDSVTGSGALVLRPSTASQNIELAGAGGTAALDLTATDLDAIAPGFSGITIGSSASGTGTLTVAGAVSFGDDVTLVGGSIDLNDSVTSSGNTVTLTARTGGITDDGTAAAEVVASALSATAQTGIDLDTDITTLTLATTTAGNISVEETTGDLAVGSVTTPGNVTLVAAGAVTDANAAAANVSASALTVTAGAGIDLDTTIATLTSATAGGAGNINIDDLSGDLAVGVVTASGDSVSITSVGAVTDGNGATANVVADDLTVSAATGIDLDTTITTLLNADVSGTGNVDISDTAGGLAVTSATTADGDIVLNATGGNLAATTVTAGGTGADVTLTTTTSGNVAVGAVTATGDAVSITSAAAVTDANGATVNVVADTLSVLSATGIDLDTTITTLLNAGVSGAGNIDISDTAGGLAVTTATTANGDIALSADGGDLTATTVTAAGAGADVTLTTTASGNVAVGAVTATGDAVSITSAGAVTDGNGATANVVANDLTVSAATGIDLDTTITTLLNAGVSGAGNIDISDTAGGLAVTAATTADGDIVLNATGGNLAATTVTAGGNGADVTLTTTTSGNVAVGAVTAAGDAVSITSAGAVTDANGATVNVVADNLTVASISGIDLDTTITTLINATLSAAGNISVADSDALAVTAVTAANGNIDITAGGQLTVASAVTTAGGNITLGATGGNLDVTTATAGSGSGANIGNITLTTTTSGDVNVGNVTAAGDTVTVTSAGNIGELAPADVGNDITGGILNLTAATSIGATGAEIEIDATTLNATAGVDVFIDEANDIVGSASAGGTITIESLGGSIGTANNRFDIINAGGAVNLTATATVTGGVHVDVESPGNDDVQFTTSSASQAVFTQDGKTFTLQHNGTLTVETDGNITTGANPVQASGTLNLISGGNIGTDASNPLLIEAGTLTGSAVNNIWVKDDSGLIVGNLAANNGGLQIEVGGNATINGDLVANGAANDHLIVAAKGSIALNGSASFDANGQYVVLAGQSLTGPGITISGTPTLGPKFVIYAQSANLTNPKFVENDIRIPPLAPGSVIRGGGFDINNPLDPTGPAGPITGNIVYVFESDAKGVNDPSLFIDIPVEVFQPVSIVFGDYDPTKFGEVGDLWMSSSELYEIERKAGKARKPLPPQIGRSEYVPESK